MKVRLKFSAKDFLDINGNPCFDFRGPEVSIQNKGIRGDHTAVNGDNLPDLTDHFFGILKIQIFHVVCLRDGIHLTGKVIFSAVQPAVEKQTGSRAELAGEIERCNGSRSGIFTGKTRYRCIDIVFK